MCETKCSREAIQDQRKEKMIMTQVTTELQEKLAHAITGKVLFDEPLSSYTTIRVGGPADILAFPSSVEEVQQLLLLADEAHLPVFVFGWGSNLLVRDGGIRGLVINLSEGLREITRLESDQGDRVQIKVGTGIKIPGLLDKLIKEGLTGMEFMAGIPATIGGALWMNAGTPEGEIGQVVHSVTYLSKKGRLHTVLRKDCGFSYRHSDFPAGAVLVEAVLNLHRGDPEQIRSAIDAKKSRRVETQPLNLPNLGSVFKNPSKRQQAGRLIEDAGLKSIRVGQARISAKHGNFIVNEGEAKAKEVLALIGLIKDKVKEKCHVRLETEVRVVGQDLPC